jgi:transposase-like protein
MSGAVVDLTTEDAPERRADERSEAVRSGGASSVERRTGFPGPDVGADPEVTAHRRRRRFTAAYKLGVLRQADACTQPGQLGALLRKEGLYSSHLVTWRQQRAAGLSPKKRGRPVSTDPRVAHLEREKAALEAKTRRLERRLEQAGAIIAFQREIAGSSAEPVGGFGRRQVAERVVQGDF